jgi:hypothetical protein
MALRVVQWTTGNVGRRSVRAIVAKPDLELVGCYAWSPDKTGRDVGELCGIDPIGVTATNDIDALLALKPDCVVYNPMWPSTDELVRVLEAGVNVVSTAAFINGKQLGADGDRIADACERGGATIFGTGISPGFVELMGIATANICDRIDKITIDEGSDTTLYDSPATELPCGFGRPIDDPELPGMAAKGTAVFGEAVAMVADALGIELDEIACEAEYAKTTEDVVMDSWTIDAGCVAGVYASWQGRVDGRTIVELNVRWRKGQTLEPSWDIVEGHVITIAGRPTVTVRFEYLPPPDFEATTFADFMVLGMIMTAMPAINAIPYVVDAAPGIVTYNDLPLPLPRGLVPG